MQLEAKSSWGWDSFKYFFFFLEDDLFLEGCFEVCVVSGFMLASEESSQIALLVARRQLQARGKSGFFEELLGRRKINEW